MSGSGFQCSVRPDHFEGQVFDRLYFDSDTTQINIDLPYYLMKAKNEHPTSFVVVKLAQLFYVSPISADRNNSVSYQPSHFPERIVFKLLSLKPSRRIPLQSPSVIGQEQVLSSSS
jgi:hypothetical protein